MRIFGGIAKIAVPDDSVPTEVSGTSASDAALLAAHVAGDREAFATLLSRHYDHLWQVARRTSYSPEDAADSLQEALLSAHRMAANFRQDAAVRSWMHTIVVNACLDRIRRNKVRPTVPLFTDESEKPRAVRDSIHDTELALDVRTALFTLPPDQRAAIVAVDVEGYSVREAALRLGVPEGTVKSRCARARRKLAVVLGDLRE
ncbi:RNA polymerase sigma-70 factor (ECF subfamily) [Rhodococcus coprophilus]|uniref:Sigma-70 factor n=1 Tax=Rhodococcus coprophilus TaxID=38310 RepID=A0A2X4U1H0_9NOCA|nr:RNA polymerase sigma-70 factor (ECF subfamily) [Rhodococcus coprophilus]SQI33647.1 sigma-70 factor [Rhodococcus coprophilus]